MFRYHASWVLPISGPPIRDGWVAVDRGRVAAVGQRLSQRSPAESSGTIDRELGDVVLMPGLVNAHTHLELSYLKGQVPPAADFVGWVRQVMGARRQHADARDGVILEGVSKGIDEAIGSGTVLVGDISNTLVAYEPLTRSALAAVVFYELIRFNSADPEAFVEQAVRQLEALRSTGGTDHVRTSLAAHAPYSVAPLVFRAIRKAVDRDPFVPTSVHLSESAEEVRFIKSGDGPWRTVLEELGVWNPSWIPPANSPVQYLDEAGFLGPRVLAIHGVQMSAGDLARLASRGTTLVTCPRSNVHTGAGTPPIEAFYASGVRMAVGTDSLASTPDLNVFAELATLHELAPSVKPAALLESATREGARALGFEDEYGTIEPGKRARLIAVSLPAVPDDVEEYLVSGIRPEQIRWVEDVA